MSRNLTGWRESGAARSRWFGAGAVALASCAAMAVLSTGGHAQASQIAAQPAGQASNAAIKACYQTSASPSTLKHVPSSAKCPSGYSSLTWNQVGPKGATGPKGPTGPPGATGPQGPAGISMGTSGSSTTSVPLDQAAVLTPVMSAAVAPASGTYYVSASVQLIVGQGDTVTCILYDNGVQGSFATVGPVASASYETIPLTAAMTISAGDKPAVYCADYTSSTGTSFYDGGITGTLITSAAGNSPRAGAGEHRVKPPRL
jgi:hypothetical protein